MHDKRASHDGDSVLYLSSHTQFLPQSKPRSDIFLETHSGCHVPITDFYKDHLRSKWKQLCCTRAH